jgi:curved DNA-binding protein CbpA
MKNYYEILGVSSNSTKDEIKSAYKKLAVKFHPDKNDGSLFFEEMFKKIQEAYENLSEDYKRKKHDFELSDFENRKDFYKKAEQDLKAKEDFLKKQADDLVKEKEKFKNQTTQTTSSAKKDDIAYENGSSRLSGLQSHRKILYFIIVGLIIFKFAKPYYFKTKKDNIIPITKEFKKTKIKSKKLEIVNLPATINKQAEDSLIDEEQKSTASNDVLKDSLDKINLSKIGNNNLETIHFDKAKLFIKSDFGSKNDIVFLEQEVGKNPLDVDFFDIRIVKKRLKFLMDKEFKEIDFYRRQSKDCDAISKTDNYLKICYSLPNQPYLALLYVDILNNEFILFLCNGFQKKSKYLF